MFQGNHSDSELSRLRLGAALGGGGCRELLGGVKRLKAVRVGSRDELIIGVRPMAKAFSWCRCPPRYCTWGNCEPGYPRFVEGYRSGHTAASRGKEASAWRAPQKFPPLIFLLLHLPLDSLLAGNLGCWYPGELQKLQVQRPSRESTTLWGILFRTIHFPHTSAQKSVPAAWAPPERVGDRLRRGAGRKLEGAGTG